MSFKWIYSLLITATVSFALSGFASTVDAGDIELKESIRSKKVFAKSSLSAGAVISYPVFAGDEITGAQPEESAPLAHNINDAQLKSSVIELYKLLKVSAQQLDLNAKYVYNKDTDIRTIKFIDQKTQQSTIELNFLADQEISLSRQGGRNNVFIDISEDFRLLNTTLTMGNIQSIHGESPVEIFFNNVINKILQATSEWQPAHAKSRSAENKKSSTPDQEMVQANRYLTAGLVFTSALVIASAVYTGKYGMFNAYLPSIGLASLVYVRSKLFRRTFEVADVSLKAMPDPLFKQKGFDRYFVLATENVLLRAMKNIVNKGFNIQTNPVKHVEINSCKSVFTQ